ncbi:MAG TPA: hypothetical protein VNK24_06605 [Elusimicrobiota bacterium]|nr:hypothetical protein [Elusimicrobiota bacterium]
MREYHGLRPQDILVLLKLLVSQGRDWRQVDLAHALGLSQYEISAALARAEYSGFLDHSKKRLNKSALGEFLLHGLKYVYPAKPGAVCRGVPTAHSALPISKQIVSSANDQYVWPHAEGEIRGQSIPPLYESAPEAARKDPRLHELLALVDALRVGRARERQIAAEELKRRLHES